MSGRGDFIPQDPMAWMLAIGRRLKAEYDAVAEPVPERLAALVRRLEAQSGAGSAERQSPEAEIESPATLPPRPGDDARPRAATLR